MDNVKIFIDGIEKEVFGLFYVYNSKYYFIYTEKELDENGYVILYMAQIGKETANTQAGVVETGYMIGAEITDPTEQKNVQTSVSYIVEDKKNGTINPAIQYLPINMLKNLKLLGKKRFRLLKTIMVDNFKLSFENEIVNVSEPQNVLDTLQPVTNSALSNIQSVAQPLNQISNVVQPMNQVQNVQMVQSENQNANIQNVVEPMNQIPNTNMQVQQPQVNNEINSTPEATVIIDYRARFFEEQEKSNALQSQIDELTQRLNDIKKIIE